MKEFRFFRVKESLNGENILVFNIEGLIDTGIKNILIVSVLKKKKKKGKGRNFFLVIKYIFMVTITHIPGIGMETIPRLHLRLKIHV